MRRNVKKFYPAFGSVAGLTLLGGLLSGCANPAPRETEYVPHAGKATVLSSVAVWANIAQTIGGPEVIASAIIAGPNRDPHSYEASVRDQLAVNQADITIANGADYDTFFSKLVNHRPSINAIMNLDLAQQMRGSTANPHFWYSLADTARATQSISNAERIAMQSQDQAIQIQNRTDAFIAALKDLQSREAKIRAAHPGKTALLTEPFAAYMLADLGIDDLTPATFRNAVEQEQDASPAVMQQMQDLLANHKISVLIVNRQTTSSQTKQLVTWARKGQVPVLNWSELLPANTTYLEWMSQNLTQIEGIK